MWNDEDNNPYGSFERQDSEGPPHVGRKLAPFAAASMSLTLTASFNRPATPTSDTSSTADGPPPYPGRRQSDSSDEYEKQISRAPRKQGGYDSRIEQILYEHPELEIIITDAGKSHENGGGYIAYTIRTGVGSSYFSCFRSADVLGSRTVSHPLTYSLGS